MQREFEHRKAAKTGETITLVRAVFVFDAQQVDPLPKVSVSTRTLQTPVS